MIKKTKVFLTKHGKMSKKSEKNITTVAIIKFVDLIKENLFFFMEEFSYNENVASKLLDGLIIMI